MLQRTESGGVTRRYYYFDGVKVGSVDGSVSDFDHSYSPVARQTNANPAPPTYTVRDGDTP